MDPIATYVLASWNWNAGTLCLLLAIAALYVRGWLRLHAELPHKYTSGKLVSFTFRLLAILIAVESPFHAFGALLLQAHFIQHPSLIAVAAPFLLREQPVLPLMTG